MADMAQYLLCKHPVAIIGSRLKPFDPHRMDRRGILNAIAGIEIAGTFRRIEIGTIIRR